MTEENTERDLTEEKTEKEIQKPIWFEMNKKEFEELTGDIYNNQINNDFKVTIKKLTYDLNYT